MDFGAKRKKKAKKNPEDDTEYETVAEVAQPEQKAVVSDSN